MSADKAYKNRIYPNANQKIFLKVFGFIKFLYSKMLSYREKFL
ncbi:helix-turn-helix domain-containing protein [Borreliella americana]|nr:helix-turn-helix domain-containing protein [Borreliella americana]MCD2349827.1 helix-turn-helix domain-containing protein [Borreliella americana]